MLEIIKYNEDEYAFPCLLVLGCFDSIHIGHAELLKKAKLQAKINGLDLGVMMFTGGKGGRQVYTFEERQKLLEQYNVKFILAIDYNEEFKKQLVKEYIQGKSYPSLEKEYGVAKSTLSGWVKKYSEE